MDKHTHLAFEKCLLIEWAWSVSQSVRLAAITRRTSFLVTTQNGKIHRLFGACCAVAFLCGTSFVGKCYEPDIISKWYSGTIRSSLAPHQYFNIGLQNLLNISLELIRLDLMHNTLKQIGSTCYIFPCCLNQRAFCSSMQIPGTHSRFSAAFVVANALFSPHGSHTSHCSVSALCIFNKIAKPQEKLENSRGEKPTACNARTHPMRESWLSWESNRKGVRLREIRTSIPRY